jgi:type I restriction enzyme, S subunit
MSRYPLVPLLEMADIFDHLREPINQTIRNKRVGTFPYYGATGQVGTIDDYRQDGKYVLLGEDGAPFLDPNKTKAYIVEGKCWVNNHAHVLRGKVGICDDDYLCFALNYADYSNAVTGSTRLKLPQNMMGNLLIPKPLYEEQKLIAAHYKNQVAEIEKAINALLINRQDLHSLMLKQQRKALGILENLDRVPLSDYLESVEAGKSIQTSELLAKKDEVGVLKVSAVSWDRFQPDEAKSVFEGYNPPNTHRIKKGDFIISRANTLELVGAVVLVEDDYPYRLLSDKTLRLVLKKEKILSEYLLYILKMSEARKHIEENATGTSNSMRNISQKTIYSIPIPAADEILQKRIINLMQGTRTHLKTMDEALRLEDYVT